MGKNRNIRALSTLEENLKNLRFFWYKDLSKNVAKNSQKLNRGCTKKKNIKKIHVSRSEDP